MWAAIDYLMCLAISVLRMPLDWKAKISKTCRLQKHLITMRAPCGSKTWDNDMWATIYCSLCLLRSVLYNPASRVSGVLKAINIKGNYTASNWWWIVLPNETRFCSQGRVSNFSTFCLAWYHVGVMKWISLVSMIVGEGEHTSCSSFVLQRQYFWLNISPHEIHQFYQMYNFFD